MEPPLFRSNADEANAAAPSFHKELEELNLKVILTSIGLKSDKIEGLKFNLILNPIDTTAHVTRNRHSFQL